MTTTTDLRGVPVSTSDRATLDIFEQAIVEFQSYVGDAVGTIDRALETRPDFALGHAFKVAALATFGEARFFELARPSLAALEALVERGTANDRERALAVALRRLIDGDWHGASVLFDRALLANPRDIIALQTAHLFDFARGDALNLRNRVTRVLPAWSRDVPGFSYVLGLHAFGLEECNQYDEALATAQRALEIEPHDAWAVHAGLHTMEMRGQIDEGVRWLETRQPQWAPNNGFAFHNHWHLALLYLDRDDIPRVLEIFDRDIYPEPVDIAYTLVDASALLWRLHLLGIDVTSRFERVAAVWQTKLDGERGFYAFNDIHALLAFAALGREDAIARVSRDLESTAVGGSTNAAMTREVGIPLARGITAFAKGRYGQCVSELESVRDIAHRFGGSHAQRDILTLTIIEAALRGGQREVARHYLNERIVQRPNTGLGTRLLARATS
jgi:tetratricopeptide (TPR) repeat protein